MGLTGVYAAYLARHVQVPSECDVWIVVGNTDAYTLWLNGVQIGSVVSSSAWTPYNGSYRARLNRGINTIAMKLIKSTDAMKFTLAIREDTQLNVYGDIPNSANFEDWKVDIADKIPALYGM